ncbi:MAG TPA: LysR family transcriptional regulator [Caldimonas sp.]|nr:LysR family transcriptional regulator [Caldimonas sp.]
MTINRNVLTPEALTMMDVIARTGSFAAAARELGKVPSSLTYNVRQLEDALDVLLFDRRSRQARLTAAGTELLEEGRRLLEQIDAVANRVKRVATGWEAQLTIAVDGAISRPTMLDLCSAFYAIESSAAGSPPSGGPGTRLRLRTEVMAGTWEALATGRADLAIGVGLGREAVVGVHLRELGVLTFVFAVAPHHPLARAEEPLPDAEIVRHRAVAVADSAQRLAPYTVNLLPGQDVLTVSNMQTKIDAQIRGMGCGFLPEPMVRAHVEAGHLVAKAVERAPNRATLGYAWCTSGGRKARVGHALRWWLEQLERPATRRALLERHASPHVAHGS